jgi:hypothetical protein
MHRRYLDRPAARDSEDLALLRNLLIPLDRVPILERSFHFMLFGAASIVPSSPSIRLRMMSPSAAPMAENCGMNSSTFLRLVVKV